jgi:hypothetical protein
MKVNEEELSIIPSTPRYAKDHMEIYRHAKGFLGWVQRGSKIYCTSTVIQNTGMVRE